MIALISPAKTMRSCVVEAQAQTQVSTPRFAEQTHEIIASVSQYSAQELSEIFKVSMPIARELKGRFEALFDPQCSALQAVDSYDGVVYKHFKDGLTLEHRSYLQQHLRISSLLYGLLRPVDMIKPYRMEGFVRLSSSDERVDKFWRDHQTQTLIDDVNAEGGVLLYLASKEEQNSFHWSAVKKAVRVIDFKFLQHKGDKLRQVVVYTKMARGEMIRFMAENSVEDHEALKMFEWGGYRYDELHSTPNEWVWIME